MSGSADVSSASVASASSTYHHHQPAASASGVPQTASHSPTSSPLARNPIVDHGLDAQLHAGQLRYSLRWGSINVALLSVVLYDLARMRAAAFGPPVWRSAGAHAAAAVLALSVLYHFTVYFYRRFSLVPVCGTAEQRRLLRFDEGDRSFVTTTTTTAAGRAAAGGPSPAKAGLNASNLSWHSSFNECRCLVILWLLSIQVFLEY